jgi:hypothetical protein
LTSSIEDDSETTTNSNIYPLIQINVQIRLKKVS